MRREHLLGSQLVGLFCWVRIVAYSVLYFGLPLTVYCQSFDSAINVTEFETFASNAITENRSELESSSAQQAQFDRILQRAKIFAKCFTLAESGLPTANTTSHLITNAHCGSSTECELCLQKVRDCDSTDCLLMLQREMEAMDTGSHTWYHLSHLSPTLKFHCYRSNRGGTHDVNFRMEYDRPLLLDTLARESPDKIPRVFIVEKMGTKYDIDVTPSWLLSYVTEHHEYIRVTPVAPSVVFNTITTEPMHFKGPEGRTEMSPKITSVEYDAETVGWNSTRLLVRWESSLGTNASCNAAVYYLDGDDDEFVKFERKEPQDAFWADITKPLKFGKSYTIKIGELYEGQESKDQGSHVVQVKNCVEIYNHSFNLCPPPKPVIDVVKLSAANELMVTWSPPPHTSITNQVLHYNLTVNVLNSKSVGGHIPSLHSLPTYAYSVPGNETSWKFNSKNITFSGKIEVFIQATSKGGKSEIAYSTIDVLGGGEEKEVDNGIFQKIWMTLLACVLLVIIVAVCAFIKNHRGKLQRKKQLHEYFEKLDKESIHIEPAVVDRYSSKWEIPSGDLVLGDVIGEGAFGLVRKAMMYRNGHKIIVAVKTLRDGVDENDSGKFWEEFNILKGLDPHKHVVGLVGIVKAHVPALVVEYCHGGDLQSHLRKSSQSRLNMGSGRRISQSRSTSTNESSTSTSTSEARVRMSMVTNEAYFANNKAEPEIKITELDLLSYGRQISLGMEFLSSNKIVHRDLAARNVLIGPNRTLKIADFGLSRDVYEQNWYKKSSNGKIPIKWLAIECLLQEVYTTKSDVWSFGILLWEIVTLGGNPYPGVENTRIFDLLKSGYRMPQPENCSDELYSLMTQCWQEKPMERPDFPTVKNKLDEIIEKSNLVVYMNLEHMGSDTPSEDSDIE